MSTDGKEVSWQDQYRLFVGFDWAKITTTWWPWTPPGGSCWS